MTTALPKSLATFEALVKKGVKPPDKVSAAVRSLKKAHADADWDFLAKPSGKDIQSMADRQLPLAKDAAQQAAKFLAAVKDYVRQFKVDPKDKLAAETKKCLDDLVKEFDKFGRDVEADVKAGAEAVRKAGAKAVEAAKEEKKDDKGGDDDGDKSVDDANQRIASALKLALKTGSAKPMKFMVGVMKQQTFVYVGRATSGSTGSKIKDWMNAGNQSVTFHKGDCFFQDGAISFASPTIPMGGFGRKIQDALLAQTKKKFKLRVCRPIDPDRPEMKVDAEDIEDGDDPDSKLRAEIARRGAGMADASKILVRQEKMKRDMAAVVDAGGPAADALRKATAEFDDLVADGQFAKALAVLGEIQSNIIDTQANARSAKEKEFDDRLARLRGPVKEAIDAGGEKAMALRTQLAVAESLRKLANANPAATAFDQALEAAANLETALKDEGLAAGAAVAVAMDKDAAVGAADELRETLNKQQDIGNAAIALSGRASFDKMVDAFEAADQAIKALLKSALETDLQKARLAVDAAKLLAGDARREATKNAGKTRAKAEVAFREQMARLKPEVDKASALSGAAADKVRKLFAAAEEARAAALKTSAKDDIDAGYAAIQALDDAVGAALGRSIGGGRDDGSAGAVALAAAQAQRKRAEELKAEIERQRQEATSSAGSINDPAIRAKVLRDVRDAEAERLAAERIADLAARIAAFEAVRTKTAALADEAAAAAQTQPTAWASAVPQQKADFTRRFKALMESIATLEKSHFDDTPDIKQKAQDAAKKATNPRGVEAATLEIEALETRVAALLKASEAS